MVVNRYCGSSAPSTSWHLVHRCTVPARAPRFRSPPQRAGSSDDLDAGDRRDKAIYVLHAARLECADQLRRELLCVAQARTLADADALVHDVKAAILKKSRALRPDRDNLRVRLVLDERFGRGLDILLGIRNLRGLHPPSSRGQAFVRHRWLKQ